MAVCLSGVFGYSILNKHTKQHHLLKKDFFTMGTKGSITVATEYSHLGDIAIEQAIAKINNLDKILTKFSPTSDIGKLNQNPRKFIRVNKATFDLLQLSIELATKTNHRFDIGMGNFLTYSKLDPHIPPVGIAPTSKDLSYPLLEFQESTQSVRIIRNNSMIDLGAIGKGFATDFAMDLLIQHGIKHAIVDISGDTKVHGGQANGQPWEIGIDPNANIKDPENHILYIAHGGISSSGSYQKKTLNQNGPIKHHIVDPKSQQSQQYYLLTTVIGPSSAICDALATACYNTPPEELPLLQQQFPDYIFKTFV